MYVHNVWLYSTWKCMATCLSPRKVRFAAIVSTVRSRVLRTYSRVEYSLESKSLRRVLRTLGDTFSYSTAIELGISSSQAFVAGGLANQKNQRAGGNFTPPYFVFVLRTPIRISTRVSNYTK